MIRDAHGNTLRPFDIVLIEDVPVDSLDWIFDPDVLQEAKECRGAYAQIRYHETEFASWCSEERAEVNLQIRRFHDGKWSLFDMWLPSRCVRKIENSLVISLLFVDLQWMVTLGEEMVFPALDAKRYHALFRRILDTPLEKLENLSDQLADALCAENRS